MVYIMSNNLRICTCHEEPYFIMAVDKYCVDPVVNAQYCEGLSVEHLELGKCSGFMITPTLLLCTT